MSSTESTITLFVKGFKNPITEEEFLVSLSISLKDNGYHRNPEVASIRIVDNLKSKKTSCFIFCDLTKSSAEVLLSLDEVRFGDEIVKVEKAKLNLSNYLNDKQTRPVFYVCKRLFPLEKFTSLVKTADGHAATMTNFARRKNTLGRITLEFKSQKAAENFINSFPKYDSKSRGIYSLTPKDPFSYFLEFDLGTKSVRRSESIYQGNQGLSSQKHLDIDSEYMKVVTQHKFCNSLQNIKLIASERERDFQIMNKDSLFTKKPIQVNCSGALIEEINPKMSIAEKDAKAGAKAIENEKVREIISRSSELIHSSKNLVLNKRPPKVKDAQLYLKVNTHPVYNYTPQSYHYSSAFSKQIQSHPAIIGMFSQ